MKSQILDLKSQISNCRCGVRWSGVLSIFILQFAICNLQSLSYAEPPKPPSTDDQLRKSLDEKSGDDYDRELMGETKLSQPKSTAPEPETKHVISQQRDQGRSPLAKIAADMRDASKALGKDDSGESTQFLQRQIAADLQKLIDDARKSGSGKSIPGPAPGVSRSSPIGNASKPSATSDPQEGGERSDPRLREPEEIRADAAQKARDQIRELWSLHLQEHPNDRKLEAPAEKFLPEYEREIEDYFRRMSEEHPELDRP